MARPSFLFPTQQSVTSSTDTGKVLAYAISFAGSIAAALSFIFVRKSNAATPALTLLLHFGVACVVSGLLSGIALGELRFPDCGTRDNWYALHAAVFSFAGQVCFVYALTIEKAAIVVYVYACVCMYVYIYIYISGRFFQKVTDR